MQLAAFLERVAAALAARDGQALAQLLSLTRAAEGGSAVDLRSVGPEQLARACAATLARFDAFAEVVAGLLQARQHAETQHFEAAYTSQIASVMYVASRRAGAVLCAGDPSLEKWVNKSYSLFNSVVCSASSWSCSAPRRTG